MEISNLHKIKLLLEDIIKNPEDYVNDEELFKNLKIKNGINQLELDKFSIKKEINDNFDEVFENGEKGFKKLKSEAVSKLSIVIIKSKKPEIDEFNIDLFTRKSKSPKYYGIEEKNIKKFDKATRVIGFIIIVLFIFWGLFYNINTYSYHLSPFESFSRNFVSRSNDDLMAIIISILVFFIGFYYRYFIGLIFSISILKLFSFIKFLLKKI